MWIAKIPRVNRRDLLKYLGYSALLAALPAFKELSLGAAATHERGAAAASPSINPKWYGSTFWDISRPPPTG
jgi:hypothetical protein